MNALFSTYSTPTNPFLVLDKPSPSPVYTTRAYEPSIKLSTRFVSSPRTGSQETVDTQKPSISVSYVDFDILTSEKPLRSQFLLFSDSFREKFHANPIHAPKAITSQRPLAQLPLPTASHTSVEGKNILAIQPTNLHDPSPTMTPEDIFANPISIKPPPASIDIRKDHPVPRKGITAKSPLQTNKFYSNFFLAEQRDPTYTFPFSIAWAGGKGSSGSWGMSCSHIEAQQRVFGKEKTSGASSYFINPIGIQSMVISAMELGKETRLTVDAMTAFSARVYLSKDDSATPAVSFPIVQGMAYITAQFSGSVPLIQSGVFFRTVTKATRNPKGGVIKYTFNLEDGSTWRLYAWDTDGVDLELEVLSNSRAEAKRPFHGIIQVCKDPGTPESEAILDDGAGVYPVRMKLSGSTTDAKGTYRFSFQREGHGSGHLYMYALPHHVASFAEETRQRTRKVSLQSTTKGLATLVIGSEWIMIEPHLPINMGFSPWHPEKGGLTHLSHHAKSVIHAAAAKELEQDMIAQSNLDSMYFSGKALAKFAALLYVVKDMLEDEKLAQSGLSQLKAAFGVFVANKQKHPLVYESAWGGVVSSASYVTGDPGVDFGNTYYNDHHFHYGYHILAAAYIGHLDRRWLKDNKEYVDTLVRDIANPSAKDRYFPMWRSFDWYHGHSWAHGLYAALDGKESALYQTHCNQESSSEDMMHSYAIKMWGNVTGNVEMEKSLQHYYLYRNDNGVQPKQFIGNKVAGILFENKVDHTTYFDPNIEAIQGIHMIPILPPTPFVRVPDFVKEEWETYFSEGRIDKIDNAWKGIIYASYATVEPKKAWKFFTSKDFEPRLLDGGASLTWFMAYAAGRCLAISICLSASRTDTSVSTGGSLSTELDESAKLAAGMDDNPLFSRPLHFHEP
ncbi:putative endo-1,3(4)-beta-glucanase [Paramyrothecium foliicola]|nr:putative endo-1,3(4)-beta-glucanase [Paramyrothecium foliicola]